MSLILGHSEGDGSLRPSKRSKTPKCRSMAPTTVVRRQHPPPTSRKALRSPGFLAWSAHQEIEFRRQYFATRGPNYNAGGLSSPAHRRYDSLELAIVI